jgi:hypothetical protein
VQNGAARLGNAHERIGLAHVGSQGFSMKTCLPWSTQPRANIRPWNFAGAAMVTISTCGSIATHPAKAVTPKSFASVEPALRTHPQCPTSFTPGSAAYLLACSDRKRPHRSRRP